MFQIERWWINSNERRTCQNKTLKFGGIEQVDLEVYKPASSFDMRPKMKINERLEFDDSAKSSFQSLYAPVEINNIKLEMLIDTGSPVTLIAENIIESLGVGLSDLSRVESTLSAADGNTMSIKGK